MKNKMFLTTFLLFAGMSATLMNAQRMTINLHDGTNQGIELKSLQKLTFSDNNLVLNFTNGTFESVGIPTIKTINVSSSSVGIKNETANPTKLSIFFNASDDQISIQNAPEKATTAILYRPDGVTVLKTQISSGNSFINASSLKKGIYLLKINNQVFKFKK